MQGMIIKSKMLCRPLYGRHSILGFMLNGVELPIHGEIKDVFVGKQEKSMGAMLSSDLLTFYRQISQQPLTVVDVETTGYMPSYNRITEIAILQARLGDGVF